MKAGGDFVHFVVGIERVFFDAQFVSLPGHDVDGVVEDAFDQEIAQLSQQHMGIGEVAHGHRQRPDMIVVAMGDGDVHPALHRPPG